MSRDAATTGGTLVYERAKQDLLRLIEDRSYVAGDRIPSERDLSQRFGVHRMTMRKAIGKLVDEGVLERRGGSGTYVPAPVVMRPISHSTTSPSISAIVKQSGGRPGSRLLFFEQNEVSVRIASKLNLKVGERIISIKRLRISDDLPFCIETTCIPAFRVPGLAAEDLYEDQSLYEVLERRYGIRAGKVQATLSASTVSSQDSEILGLKGGEYALVIQSVIQDTEGEPFEFLTSLNHPRRVMFTID